MKIIKIIKTDTINIALHTDAKVKADVLNNVLTSKDKPKKKTKKTRFLMKGKKKSYIIYAYAERFNFS